MRPHGNGNQQIACGAAVFPGVALSPDGNGLAVVDARRDLGLNGTAFPLQTAAAAGRAGSLDDPALAAAAPAGRGGGEDAHRRLPPHLHLTGAVAVRADLRGRAVGAAGAVAGGTGLIAVYADLLLTAEGGLLKADGHTQTDALAPLGGVGIPPLGGTESAAEKAAEDVPQIAEVKAAGVIGSAACACACAVVGIYPRKAELVITGLLIGVGENLIGLVDLLELLLRFLIVGVQIRVVLPGHFLICFFDLVLRGALINAKNFVIITFFCCHTLHPPCAIRNQEPETARCGLPFQAPQP